MRFKLFLWIVIAFLCTPYGWADEIQWVRRLQIAGKHPATPKSVMDNNGNLYLVTTTGSIYGKDGNTEVEPDVLLVKYAPDGTMLWQKTFGSNGEDESTAITIDNNGFVYITGTAPRNFISNNDADKVFSGSNRDVFVMKVSGDGDAEWTSMFGTDDDDSGEAIFVTPAGEVYVAWTYRYNSNPFSLVSKLDTHGKRVWTERVSIKNLMTNLGVIAVASGGDVFVGGYCLPIKKPDESGKIIISTSDPQAGCIAKLNVKNGKVWEKILGWEIANLIPNDKGGVFMSGSKERGVEFVAEFSASGDILWSKFIKNNGLVHHDFNSMVKENNNLYIFGWTDDQFPGEKKMGGIYDSFLAKFSTKGDQVWIKQLGFTQQDIAWSGASANGRVALVGEVENENDSNKDDIFVKMLLDTK